MKEFVFNVKEKSIIAFFQEKLLYPPNPKDVGAINMEQISPYRLLKDELLFKKDCGIRQGESFVIELEDRSEGSNSKLNNRYIYTAKPYDDIAIKVVLQEFKVNQK